MTAGLGGQVAIVTGAGRGLGQVLSHALGAAGARLYITARRPEVLAETLATLHEAEITAQGRVLDVNDPTAAADTLAAAVAAFGRVDVLVNNAAVYLWRGFLDLSLEEWQTTIDTNLTAPFVWTQAMAKTLIGQGTGGVILNIGSVHGTVADPSVVAQCASKAGLVGLTRAAAEALRPHRIRVNLIAPGAILADSQVLETAGPDARVTQNDVAQMAVLLASGLGSSISGSVIEAFGATHQVLVEG